MYNGRSKHFQLFKGINLRRSPTQYTISSFDTVLFKDYEQKSEELLLKTQNYFESLNRVISNCQIASESNQFQNDSIIYCLNQVCAHVNEIPTSIGRMDEYKVFNTCFKLNSTYKTYDSLLIAKSQLELLR